VALRTLLVDAPLEDVLRDECLQAIGEDVRGDAQVLLDRREAAHAIGDVAQDQRRPPLPGHVQRPGDRAWVMTEGGALHGERSVSLA
jgi:hypothetical protein